MNIDWGKEMNEMLDQILTPNRSDLWHGICRLNAGRLYLLMQEFLGEQEREAVLSECSLGPDMAGEYKRLYLVSIREQFEIP